MNTPQSQGDAASSSNCTTEDQIDDLLEMDNSYYLDDEMESSQENQDCWNEMYDLSKMNDSQVNESINVEAAINEVNVKAAKAAEDKEKSLRKERKEVDIQKKKRVRYSPPGLKIFNSEYLTYFKRKDLNIEKHFGYQRKKKVIEKIKMPEQKIDEIFNIPWRFVNYLSPETTTPLIESNQDFIAICDFLFFSHVSTKCSDTAAITKKALFSLLKNYAYEYCFGLRHIIPALLNLGMEESTLIDPTIYYMFYKDEAQYEGFLGTYIDVNKLKGFDINSFKPKFLDQIIPNEVNGNYEISDSEDDDLSETFQDIKLSYVDSDEEDDGGDSQEKKPLPQDYKWDTLKHELVQRTIKTICDIMISFPLKCDVVPRVKGQTDRCQVLAAYYILATVALDWHLIVDSRTRGNVMNAFRTMLDGYSREQWKGTDRETTVMYEIAEALVAVGNQKSFANLRPWLPEEVPTFMENYHIVDHHHNIVRRLDLLPPTHRGQIIRKMLAHFHFQEFLGKGILSDTADEKTSIIPHVGAKEAWGLLRKNMNKFKLYNQEYYAMMSMIRLLDAIVGNEPFMDFKEKTYDEAIKHIKDHLERYRAEDLIRAKTRNCSNDVQKLRELLSLVTSKWGQLYQSYKEGRQTLMEKYLEPISLGNSDTNDAPQN